MHARKLQPEINPTTGKPLSYAERSAARKRVDRQKRIEERQQQEAKRQADAIAPAPPPAPTFEQRQANMKAAHEAKKEAQHLAEQRAAANAGPVNPFRVRAAELSQKLYQGASIQKRYDRMLEQADAWDAKHAAEQAAEARRQEIASTPAIQRAVAYVEGMEKLNGKSEALSAIRAVIGEGEADLAWSKIRALEETLWAEADAKAAAAHQAKSLSDTAFTTAANEAQAAKERAEEAAKMIGGSDDSST